MRISTLSPTCDLVFDDDTWVIKPWESRSLPVYQKRLEKSGLFCFVIYNLKYYVRINPIIKEIVR